MSELEELKLAYAECSRQKNELLTKHKHLSAEVEALRKKIAEQPAAPVLTDDGGDLHIAYMLGVSRGKEAAIPPGHCVVKDEPVAWIERDGSLVWVDQNKALGRNLYVRQGDSNVRTL